MALLFPTSKKKGGQVLQGAADGFLEAAFPKTMARIKSVKGALSKKKPAAGVEKKPAARAKEETLHGTWEPGGRDVTVYKPKKNRLSEPPVEGTYSERKKASKLLGVDLIGGGK